MSPRFYDSTSGHGRDDLALYLVLILLIFANLNDSMILPLQSKHQKTLTGHQGHQDSGNRTPTTMCWFLLGGAMMIRDFFSMKQTEVEGVGSTVLTERQTYEKTFEHVVQSLFCPDWRHLPVLFSIILWNFNAVKGECASILDFKIRKIRLEFKIRLPYQTWQKGVSWKHDSC